MPDLPRIRVFVSSPSDVEDERKIVERVVVRLDGIWKGHVRLDANLWEHDHYEAVRSFQESIGEMAAFDIVIGIVWKKLGSPLPPDRFRREDGSSYESGTVFELESAIACGKERGEPAVYVFRKMEAVTYTAAGVDEERRQHESLKAWWNRTFLDDQGHFKRGYQEFLTLDELEHSLENLLEHYLRKKSLIPAGLAWDIEAKGSPYPGLLPYDGEYSEVFFGRALAVAAAMEELRAAASREAPVLLIVGPSGSGKSSLARAGLAPHFNGQHIAKVNFWRKLVLGPAQDLFLVFAQRLYAEGALPELAASPQPTPEAFAALALRSPEDASLAIKWGLNSVAKLMPVGGVQLPVGRLLLVLDQLETLLDSAQHRELSRFVRALVKSETTWLVGTLRTDRYADLQLEPDLLDLRRRGAMYDLPPPGPSEIADIIKGPARAAGLDFEESEGKSLAKVINGAVSGADALPLLQMTLARLFDSRDGYKLTFTAYEAMGGLEGAIAAHAEAVFGTVSPEGQVTLDALLRSLVADIDADGRLTIRTPPRAAVTGDEPSRELVDKLTEGRLLVNSDGGVRIAHEALLRRWRRATKSPALQPEAIRLRRQIEPNFEVWQRTGLDNDLLQAGTTTIAAAETIVRTHPGAFPPDLEAYIRHSLEFAKMQAQAQQDKAEADAKRARRRAYTAMVIAVAFAGLALVAFVIYIEAQENFTLALLTKAEQYLLDERPDQALVAASAAEDSDDLSHRLKSLSNSDKGNDELVRSNTIVTIASPASKVPIRTLTLPAQGEAHAVAISNDGRLLAIGDEKGQVTVARTDASGNEYYLHLNKQPIKSIKFSNNDRWIATASGEDVLRLWNLQTNETRVLCGHHAQLNDVAFDPTGRYVASASNDGQIIVWDLANFKRIVSLDYTGNGKKVLGWALALEFSHGGDLLASSDDLGNVFMRSTSDWKIRKVISTGRTDLISLSFNSNDTWVATASIEGPLDLWDVNTGGKVKSITDHRNKLMRVRFSPDGRTLAAATWDGMVRLWSARPESQPAATEPIFPYAGTINGNDHWVTDIAFSKDGHLLATAGEAGSVRLWDMRNLSPMFYTTQDDRRETLSGSYSPNGSEFVSGGRDGFANLYNVDHQGLLKFHCSVKHEDWVNTVAFSHDGNLVVSSGTVEGSSDNTIKIWNSSDCSMRQEIGVASDVVEVVAFAPNGSQIAWATMKGDVRISGLGPEPKTITLPHIHDGRVRALCFSPDGRLLASAGQDRKVVVWNMQKSAVDRVLQGHEERVTGAAFSPNGQIIATSGEDNHVFIWDLRRSANSPMARLRVRGGASGLPVFSPEGKFLAIGADARFISVWSLQNLEEVFELDALVGVRGAFGFRRARGDFAFDGENGTVRILPQLLLNLSEKHPLYETKVRDVRAVLEGTDVFFDEIKSNVVQPREVTPILGESVGCEAVQ